MLTASPQPPKTYVLFLRPTVFEEGWERTDLWRRAATLPNTTVLRDDDGAERFGELAPSAVCVNVSSRQFIDGDLAGDVEAILQKTGLDPSRLKLEITESAFIGDLGDAQRILNRLRSIGVEWSIDDFGVGYSSLSQLHQLQVNTVKIDRSFVSRVGLDADAAQMVRVIVALARTLSMDVVAEGVETEAQSDHLRALGCQYTQGFHFSKPIDAEAADRLIASQPWCAAANVARLVGAAECCRPA